MLLTAKKLSDALFDEWMANARRWEPVAQKARSLGLHVWNPPLYTAQRYRQFLDRFAPKPKGILMVGLNPGPHGMAQTGIPFTDCRTAAAKLGLSIELPGHAPHDLQRWLRNAKGRWRSTYERSSLGVYRFLELGWHGGLDLAFERVYIANPCPLLFFSRAGKNVTPADAVLRKLPEMQMLRCEALRNAHALLSARTIVCLGADAGAAMGPLAASLVGETHTVLYPHPARAVPESWARGLVLRVNASGERPL